MSRNAYLAVGRLATHPAFSLRSGMLRCPICGEEHSKVKEYDKHFLAHKPTLDLGKTWLSWRTFERAFGRPCDRCDKPTTNEAKQTFILCDKCSSPPGVAA